MKDGGAIFKNKYQNKTASPAMCGSLEVSPVLLSALVAEVLQGRPAKLHVAAWKNTAESGDKYLTLKVQIPYKPKAENELPLDEDPLDL